MSTQHDETKLKKRLEGSGPIFAGYVKPGAPLPEHNIQAGSRIILKSAAGIPIIAHVLSIHDDQIISEIIGFEQWSDEFHDGMTHGDTIVCSEAYVIGCSY